MPFKSAEAFVLRAHAVGEADQILVFLTAGDGKLRGIAHSSRRSRKRFGGALEPLSHVRVSYFERENAELARIDQCDLLHSFFRLQENLRTAGYLSYLAELSEEFGREKQEDLLFFRLLRATLEAIESGVDAAWAARYFELWTLRLHGLLPDLSSCARCERPVGCDAGWSVRDCGLLCTACSTAQGVTRCSPDMLAHLRLFLCRPPAEAGGDADLLPACEEFLGALLTQFTERGFRSLRVLRDLGVR